MARRVQVAGQLDPIVEAEGDVAPLDLCSRGKRQIIINCYRFITKYHKIDPVVEAEGDVAPLDLCSREKKEQGELKTLCACDPIIFE